MNNEPQVGFEPPFRVLSNEQNEVTLELTIDKDLPAFSGHFPGLPVLPGVVQLHWAAKLSEQFFATKGHAQRIDALKFQNIISPPCRLRLVLKRLETQKVAFYYLMDEAQASSGRITFVDK